MTDNDIKATIQRCILQVANDQGLPVATIEDHHSVVEDLGFASLDVATLTALLENAFGFDPFAENIAVITEIRTVADMCAVYQKGLSGNGQDSADIAVTTDGDTQRGQRRREAMNRRFKPRGQDE